MSEFNFNGCPVAVTEAPKSKSERGVIYWHDEPCFARSVVQLLVEEVRREDATIEDVRRVMKTVLGLAGFTAEQIAAELAPRAK